MHVGVSISGSARGAVLTSRRKWGLANHTPPFLTVWRRRYSYELCVLDVTSIRGYPSAGVRSAFREEWSRTTCLMLANMKVRSTCATRVLDTDVPYKSYTIPHVFGTVLLYRGSYNGHFVANMHDLLASSEALSGEHDILHIMLLEILAALFPWASCIARQFPGRYQTINTQYITLSLNWPSLLCSESCPSLQPTRPNPVSMLYTFSLACR